LPPPPLWTETVGLLAPRLVCRRRGSAGRPPPPAPVHPGPHRARTGAGPAAPLRGRDPRRLERLRPVRLAGLHVPGGQLRRRGVAAVQRILPPGRGGHGRTPAAGAAG